MFPDGTVCLRLGGVLGRAVLDGQRLGDDWRDRFQEFDDKPTAAASIGQVHKAVWSDGREVAVKILRPGIERRIADDSATLMMAAGLIEALIPPARRLQAAQRPPVVPRAGATLRRSAGGFP